MVVVVVVLTLATGIVADTVVDRFPPPDGFTRVHVDAGSFGAWLRALPLLPEGTPVRAYDGRPIQASWARAVVDLDVGDKDLQQCADSALRLWAEYRRAHGTLDDLVLHATSGDALPWARYAAGERPFVDKNHVRWRKTAAPSSASQPATWRGYLDAVFTWAGSLSLPHDTVAVTGATRPGDLFVLGGSPGHVLVVVDVAEDRHGAQRLLLGQGFMPAQSFHLLGWVTPDDDGGVIVPSWPSRFPPTARRRFPAPR